jgi:hypothetical protein
MENEGFTQTIKYGENTYKLPNAEYNFAGEITVDEVLEKAKSAAATTEHKYGVLVTEVTKRRWDGLRSLRNCNAC